MAKIIHWTAKIINIIAILVLLFFMITQARSHEYLLFLLFIIPPVLAVWALLSGGSLAERKLAAQVRMARLEAELKELSDKI